MTTVADWLTERYLAWAQSTGKRQTIQRFAEYVGVSREVLTQWMSGRRSPNLASANGLAEKLGPEIFDILNMPRPDPLLFLINRLWGRLTDDEIKAIDRIARRAEARNHAPTDGKRAERGGPR